MGVQLPKPAAQILLLRMIHVLVAKENHKVLHQRVVHSLERLDIEWPGQVNAANFSADCRRYLPDLNFLPWHRGFSVSRGRSITCKGRRSPPRHPPFDGLAGTSHPSRATKAHPE